jgi:predicted ATPase/DNA-binding SARP family transcriptional activator
MLVEPWSVVLLGQLKADQNRTSITRFRTRKAASLFAFLACHTSRSHSREELADRFWPDDAPETARTKLRQALTSLRHQLEPVGVQAGAVIVADRTHVRMNAPSVETDVAAFESDLRQAQMLSSASDRLPFLIRAVERYGGDLLPGDYEEWALQERDRLRHRYLNALTEIVALSTTREDLPAGIDYARRLVQEDPLEEEAHLALMRLYLRAGRASDAAQQYAELTAAMEQAFDSPPGEEAQALAATLPTLPPRLDDKGRKSGRDGDRPITRPAHSTASRARALPTLPPSHPRSAPAAASAEPDSVAPAPPTTPDFTVRLPLFLTRCFGRHEAVRAVAALLDAAVKAEIEASRDLHLDFSTAQRVEKIADYPTSALNSDGARLVTLTGPGGAGKTRLAVETAHFLQTRVTYPLAFVGLAAVTEAGQILRHIAEALRLPQAANVDPLTQIADRLQASPALLILDNFEQLTPSGASIVQSLLTRVPTLRCLVTSRHHLGVPGEQTFVVEPLPLPASQQLFLDRAQATRPDFQITSHNARAVAMLCDQLEGIPLAVELAAAWIGVLTPAQMLARMNRRFDLLISRRDDRTPRHRALQATIDWSYELLSPELQRFLMRLSVFRGGWTEEAAQEVGQVRHALLLLAQLRERSLVVAEETDEGTMRFRLLESIREFAETRGDVEARQDAQQAHADFFLHLAEEADTNIAGPDQAAWFARLAMEQPNIAAALDWLAGMEQAEEAHLRLTVGMRIFWRIQGHLAESRTRFAAVLARPGVEAFATPYGNALVEVGMVASMQGEQETARAYGQRALELAQRLKNRALTASALNTLGNTAKRLRDYETAEDLYRQCLAISREIGDRRSEATAIGNLGNLAQEQSRFEEAASCYQECIAVYRQMEHKQGLVIQLYNLASLYVQTDDYRRAAPLLTECLTFCRELGDLPTIMHALEVFGFIADEYSQQIIAVELYAAAARLRKSLGLPMSARGQAYMEEVLAASRATVGADRFDALWQTGTEAPLEQTIAQAARIDIPTSLKALDRAG